MKLPFDDISCALAVLASSDGPVLVGIDGGAGSGKTTFAGRLANAVTEVGQSATVVHIDGFYKCAEDRWTGSMADQPIGHDLDWERLRDQVLLPLRAGQRTSYQPFDWPEDCLKGWIAVDPVGIVIVEGVFALRNELSGFYDLRVWFTCPSDLRASRVLARGDMTSDELERWIPGEEAYVAEHSPEERAHLVVDGAVAIDDEGRIEAARWSPPTGSATA